MKKNRLDTLLVEQGYFADADEALRAVLAHEVKVNDVYATSAAVRVAPDAEVVVKNRKRFVSRGGHKLQGALDAFGQDVRGLRCLDIGSSTGGFSDCLLQAGAASVACVDVNYGQLAWKLRQDPRVSVFERVNIKLADPVELGAPFDVLVADLSFIGLAALAPVFARLSQPGTVFKLRGKGIPNLNGRGRGDQLVRILVQVPTELNARQKELLREFEEASGARPSTGGEDPLADHAEGHKSFFDKLKDNINKEKDK